MVPTGVPREEFLAKHRFHCMRFSPGIGGSLVSLRSGCPVYPHTTGSSNGLLHRFDLPSSPGIGGRVQSSRHSRPRCSSNACAEGVATCREPTRTPSCSASPHGHRDRPDHGFSCILLGWKASRVGSPRILEQRRISIYAATYPPRASWLPAAIGLENGTALSVVFSCPDRARPLCLGDAWQAYQPVSLGSPPFHGAAFCPFSGTPSCLGKLSIEHFLHPIHCPAPVASCQSRRPPRSRFGLESGSPDHQTESAGIPGRLGSPGLAFQRSRFGPGSGRCPSHQSMVSSLCGLSRIPCPRSGSAPSRQPAGTARPAESGICRGSAHPVPQASPGSCQWAETGFEALPGFSTSRWLTTLPDRSFLSRT